MPVGSLGAKIVYTSSAFVPANGVVVAIYEDDPRWRQQCAPLLRGLCARGVDHIVGFHDPSVWPAHAAWRTRCQKNAKCAAWVAKGKLAFTRRLLWVREVARSPLVHRGALLVASDCRDVVAACGPEGIRMAFSKASAGSDVVLSAEPNLFPPGRLKTAVRLGLVPYPFPGPEAETFLRYPNAGLYAGRAGRVARFLERQRHAWEGTSDPARWTWCCPDPMRVRRGGPSWSPAADDSCTMDQQCFHAHLAAGLHAGEEGPSLAIDHWATLCMSLHLQDGPGITVLRNGTPRVDFAAALPLPAKGNSWVPPAGWSPRVVSPCFVHGNGGGKGLLKKMVIAQRRAGMAPASRPTGPGAANDSLWTHAAECAALRVDFETSSHGSR